MFGCLLNRALWLSGLGLFLLGYGLILEPAKLMVREFRSDSVLVLAGHTHGGQVNLPLIGRRVNAITLGAEHSYGFSKVSGVYMFVSAGVGTSILPIRFRSSPEIAVITIRSAAGG